MSRCLRLGKRLILSTPFRMGVFLLTVLAAVWWRVVLSDFHQNPASGESGLGHDGLFFKPDATEPFTGTLAPATR